VWAEVNLSWCYDALGDRATAVALAHHALQLSRDVKAENVELLALRCLARFQPGAEKAVTLQQAVRLAQKIQSPFNEAACLFDLVAVVADTAVRETYWQQAVTLLERCGVMGWVDGEAAAASGRTAQNPPSLPLIG
jgi:chromosome condensin MukBEF ATPase and DNA-binding subunit MukB